MAGSAPLHKTVHWRRLRDLIQMLCDYEHINSSNYDLQNINCRRTVGNLLHGHNVSYDMCDSGRSYFVTDNNYEVFEAPSRTNKKNKKFKFQKYIDYITELSLIKTGIEVTKDDTIVSLSTCTYEYKNARFVVHTKRVEIK